MNDQQDITVTFWESTTTNQKIAWACLLIAKWFFLVIPVTIYFAREFAPVCMGLYGLFIVSAIVFALRKETNESR